MTTSRDRRIAEILGESEQEIDRSLRGQALRRASSKRPPRTMTAWEWEAWYAENGVPDYHHRDAGNAQAKRGVWRRLLARFRKD